MDIFVFLEGKVFAKIKRISMKAKSINHTNDIRYNIEASLLKDYVHLEEDRNSLTQKMKFSFQCITYLD